MIIGIDGRYAEGDLVGVGNYIKDLVEGLLRKNQEIFLFYTKKPKFEIKGAKPIILPSINRYVFEQILLPQALKEKKIDVYHAAGNWGVPIFSPVPAVLTVHDIIPLEFKNYFKYAKFPLLSKISYRFRLLTSCWKAKKIMADSEYTKKCLMRRLKIKEDKISVVPLGAAEIKEGKLPKELIGQKYILNHGGIDIRKNIEKLIKAFTLVHKEFPDLKLVITGKNPYLKLKYDESVIFTGYVDENTLWALIKNASCICYPSLTEGFGMPVLEGFKAGVPVVCSNTTSLPEIAGDAALLVNPLKEKEITEAIGKVLSDQKLAQSMIEKGKKQAKKFTWERTIEKTLEVYKGVQ